MRDSPNLTFNRQAKKARLHQSCTQPSTYDVVQVRDDSSNTIDNEALYCDFRVQPLNLHKNWHISLLLVAKSKILYISVLYYIYRLRWSRGNVLAFGTQVRGFKPGRSRPIFKGEKIFSTPSFGGEVKPSVPCHRSAACKISLELRGILGQIRRNISRPRRV